MYYPGTDVSDSIFNWVVCRICDGVIAFLVLPMAGS